MEEYIVPQLIKYQSIDNLLEKNNKARSLFESDEKLSIDQLLQEDFVCIVGEPGIGKSRLVDEIRNRSSKNTLFFSTASQFSPKSVPEDSEFCIIDALDEVEGLNFFSTLQSIKEYKGENPDVKVLFTCRKHYVASYASYFASCDNLIFVELCRLSDMDVTEVINGCSEITKANIAKSAKLKELLTIPRYLTFLLEFEKQRGSISSISDLFEFIIGNSIKNAVKARSDEMKNESIRILIQRVLEKVAFIMEISRKDQISKDELYTILDGVKGNMTQMLVANFDLLFFESRILKDTNGILQFENTELQEYLAAKELCRQDNVESVLYDIAVQKELKHIYPNWYDVIPHISYTEDKAHIFINVIKLIVSYESNLENESFESLLRYVDPSILSLQQKEELFLILFDHYLRVPTYIYWRHPILQLMQKCYTSNCNSEMKPPIEHVKQFNKIQLANICAILEVIAEEDKLDKDIIDFWTYAADSLIQDDDEDKKLASLNLYNALKARDNLINLLEKYNSFSQRVKERFWEVTGYGKITNTAIVDCWLNGCFERNPYAINAVLCIEDSSTIFYAYKRIIEANKLSVFFDPEGERSVFYEPYLNKQFNILWSEDSEKKKLITRIIAYYVEKESCSILHEIDSIVKQIILDKETGAIFIKCFEKGWYIEDVLRKLDESLIDAELISALDKLLKESKVEKRYVDYILTSLINKIRKDEVKSASISGYISRYAETFAQWDKNSEKDAKRRQDDSSFIFDYQSLTDPKASESEKINAAFRLSRNIEYMKKQNSQPLVDVIEMFIDELDMDKMKLEKKEDNAFSISTMLVMLPVFVRAMFHLNYQDNLIKHRIVLAKTLPFIRCTSFRDYGEIRNIYKSIIGYINEKEKEELSTWWRSRKDDLMNISPDSVFECIKDYGLDALSYKLEEYIEEYIDNQDLDHRLAASKALEYISDGYGNWNVEKYRNVFNSLSDDTIEGVKMLCNAIMIEKYQDSEAITWRIDYLKKHVLKSLRNNTGHVRAISIEESEMTSPNPYMFRCLMNIRENEKLNIQMLDLFGFGLSLSNKTDTQEYASYLLKQIYDFFLNTNSGYFPELRKKVEAFNTTNITPLANDIMTNAEMVYLKRVSISIDKAIKHYNKCIEESHLEIRNDGDLRRFFTKVHSEVQKEIQDQGIYSLVRQESLSEDFIQRELKNTIINKCCQMGLETVRVDREVALQDNKRTDILIRYGMCNPIMIELKLLHNSEIQITKQRQEYKKKFVQYTNATNACLSVFWVFDVHKDGSDDSKFRDLDAEYKDLNNTMVLLTDCKCSSGVDTGMSRKKQNSVQKRVDKGKKKKRKG